MIIVISVFVILLEILQSKYLKLAANRNPSDASWRERVIAFRLE